MSVLDRYPALAALLNADAESAHALLLPIELALVAKSDVRIRQAVQWFDSGLIRDLKFEDFLAQVPEIPVSLLIHRAEFPFLTLVPGHVDCGEIARAAKLQSEIAWHSPLKHNPVLPTCWTWVRAHDGRPNIGLNPAELRDQCLGQRVAGTAAVGIAIYLIHGDRGDHVMLLPNSINAGYLGPVAFVGARRAGEAPIFGKRWSTEIDDRSGAVEFVLK